MSLRGALIHPVPGAGAIVWRGESVLLIRRGKPPRSGEWSIPGGRQETGERIAEAALRELQEETGLQGKILGLVDVVDVIGRDEAGYLTHHLTLADFAVRADCGQPIAGSDAMEARFFDRAQIDQLGLWSETRRVILQARAFFA